MLLSWFLDLFLHHLHKLIINFSDLKFLHKSHYHKLLLHALNLFLMHIK
jgi:hypothetical protein